MPPVAFSADTLEAMTAALEAVSRLDLDPADAIEVQLSLLSAFMGAESVSLWTDGDAAGPAAVAQTGAEQRASAEVPAVAGAILAGGDPDSTGEDGILGARIGAADGPGAGLVVTGVDPADARHRRLLAAAVPLVATLLDRRSAPPGPVDGAAERLLARLRFDLHDGPQQDVYLLTQDLLLFRDQLRPVIEGSADEARVLGRLDDLEAQVIAVDAGLRRLSTSAQSPFLLPGALADVLAELTDTFAQRTGIALRTAITGDLGRLSDSQRVAMLALITEALSNVGKHSDAETVSISITSEIRGVTVEIRDDGAGFDPEAAMAAAVGDGHLGLVGMHDRMSLLGGHTHIDSRPGGPTVISAFLPRWPSVP
jgi:signal transduction histidine kinase